jgi:hypothetical protein
MKPLNMPILSCRPLEHEQYDLVFNCFAVRNVTRFSEPLFKKK